MKKKLCLLILSMCILLSGCGKEVEEVRDVTPQVYYELNDYNTITDVNLVSKPEEFGFGKELTEEPTSFFFDNYSYSAENFSTEEGLWSTLERINVVSPLVEAGMFLLMPLFNGDGNFKQEAISNLNDVGSHYDFKFVPNSLFDTDDYSDTGVLCIRVYANEEAGVVSDVEALFYGTGAESLDMPILVYDEQQINVIKTTADAPNRMYLCHYTESNREVVQENVNAEDEDEEVAITGIFEPVITEDTMFVDSAIDPKPETIDERTYTGVQLVEAAGQYIVAQDMFDYETAIASALRISHVMRGEWYQTGDETVSILTPNTRSEELTTALDEVGSITIDYYENEGGTCRITWMINRDNMTLTVYPTGNQTIPRTRVYYNDDYTSPWIPCDFRHVMHVDFE